MISEKITMKSCVGKFAMLDRTLRNHAGEGIVAGTKVKIVSANSRGMTIKTDVCPHCGQFAVITHIKRCDLTLVGGEEK